MKYGTGENLTEINVLNFLGRFQCFSIEVLRSFFFIIITITCENTPKEVQILKVKLKKKKSRSFKSKLQTSYIIFRLLMHYEY